MRDTLGEVIDKRVKEMRAVEPYAAVWRVLKLKVGKTR
jgi:hypothetical protein